MRKNWLYAFLRFSVIINNHKSNIHDAFIFSKTGLSLSHVPLAPKLTWFIHSQPELDAKTFKYLTIADYLIHLMTGEYKTDYTYGSRTLLMNLHTLKWDSELLALFNVKKEKLCELVPQGEIIGTITGQFAAISCLPSRLPIISAGGDQQCSMLGSLCIKKSDTLITVGTGSYITTLSEEARTADHSILCGVSAIPGKYHLEASILAGANILNWYHQAFYPDSPSSDYSEMDQEISIAPIGSHGIIALPHFQGKGSPIWNPNATGLFYGVNANCTRGDFARSILEGIGFEIDENLRLIEEETSGLNSVYLAGGVSNFELFPQMVANICDCTVKTSSAKESTSLGALISAEVALGFYDTFDEAAGKLLPHQIKIYAPEPAAHEQYHELKRNHERLYEKLFNS